MSAVRRYQTPAGTDINKVGITPDIELPDGELPPPDADAFCKVIQRGNGPDLFKR